MQYALPMKHTMQEIDPALIYRQPTLTKALQLGQTLSGLDDAQFYGANGIVKDQAQWSRIMGQSGSANFPQDKLPLFMDIAGNEAPLLWLCHARGYDLSSLRQRESETERELRIARERIQQLEHDKRVLTEAIRGNIA